MNRPEKSEFDPYYNAYISLIADDDIFDVLNKQPVGLRTAFAKIPESKGTFAYDQGKWTIKEVISHIIDGERIFGYRVLRISRGDTTPIEGFEQDDYIVHSNANNRPFSDLIEEFDLQRRANMLLFNSLTDEGTRRMGIASDKPVSARALGYMMAGHVIHHLNVLESRYLA